MDVLNYSGIQVYLYGIRNEHVLRNEPGATPAAGHVIVRAVAHLPRSAAGRRERPIQETERGKRIQLPALARMTFPV